jgi:Zn-dependent protease with chaperone function/murein DD-endopeptidase MepM/ murein hydrolase activator NlpD
MVAVLGALALTPVRPAGAISLDDVVKGLILLDDDAAEQVISALGSAEVERKGISTDSQLNARADRIFRRVVTGAAGRKYQLKVLNDSTVNAYAVLGGHLYVNRGLLTTPGVTDHEIAAVIGHEIAHIEKRHGLKQIRQQLLIGYAADKISRDGEKAALVALAGQLYLSGRSQSDEREADLEGARLARQAGYNPTGAVAFMRRLEVLARNERSRRGSGSPLLAHLEQRLSTHPPTDQRCEYLKDDLFRSKYGADFRIASSGTQGARTYASAGRGRDKILLTTGPHHIGDDQAGISTIWSTTFELTEADLAERTGAKVVFLLRSTEVRRDPNVYFNRVKVGFAATQSRNWERFEFPVALTALHPGRNLIDIETIIPDLWRTYDDCEFKHVYLVFEGRGADGGLRFVFPVGGERDHAGAVIRQDLGDDFGDSKCHLGEDYGGEEATQGKPVRAVADGTLHWAGWAGDKWGHVIVLRHELDGGAIYSMYAHVTEPTKDLSSVARGEKITTIGPKALGSSGPHLHFEMKPAEAVTVEGAVGHGYAGISQEPEPKGSSLYQFSTSRYGEDVPHILRYDPHEFIAERLP